MIFFTSGAFSTSMTSSSRRRSMRLSGIVSAPPFLNVSWIAFSSTSLKPLIFIARPSVNRAMLAPAGDAAATSSAVRRTFPTTNGQRPTANELCPGMKLVIDLLQPRSRNVGVDLRRGDVRVAEHHLDGPQIGAVLQQMRGERMPQHVRRNVCADAGLPRVLH